MFIDPSEVDLPFLGIKQWTSSLLSNFCGSGFTALLFGNASVTVPNSSGSFRSVSRYPKIRCITLPQRFTILYFARR